MKPYEHERTKQIKWNFYLQKYFACKKNLGNNLFIYFDSHVYTSLDTPRCLLGAPEDLVPLAGVPRGAPVPVPVPGRLPRRAVVPLVAAAAAGAALHAAREAVLPPAGPVVRGHHQGAARVAPAAAEALFVELQTELFAKFSQSRRRSLIWP